MSSAKLTLVGLYNWLSKENIDMFESFKYLPDGIDVSVLTNMILSEGGEFEPLYANAYMMKDNVQMFILNHLRTFTKWMNALSIEYDPLENYDRKEEWTDTGHSEITASSHGDITGSAKNNVYAFDSDGVSPHDESNTSSVTNSNGGNSGDSNSEHNGRVHGNIGVTTSQQMLQSELDIARFNVYKQITDLFIDELLIAVYI